MSESYQENIKLWNLANVNNKLTRTMCEFVQSNKKDARTV